MSEFDAAYSYGSYDGNLRDLIHLFKYARVRSLARPFGRLLISALPLNLRFDAVVPMPMHWLRRWRRGFNQAELLARAVAKHTGLPCLKALRRTRSVPAQAGLTAAQRRRNTTGTFAAARRKLALEGRHILLVDDVLTTGSTARAAAAVLKRAGAARVTVLTLARADRRHYLGDMSGGQSYTIALGAR